MKWRCGQQDHTNCISYCEAKGMIKDIYKWQWTEKHNPPIGDDWSNLTRREQTTILRLRTGHNRLLHHQHRIGLSHTPECPCGTGLQNAEHILQWCPLHREARNLPGLMEQPWRKSSGALSHSCKLQPTLSEKLDCQCDLKLQRKAKIWNAEEVEDCNVFCGLNLVQRSFEV